MSRAALYLDCDDLLRLKVAARIVLDMRRTNDEAYEYGRLMYRIQEALERAAEKPR